jgi:hypothetical protein
LPFAEKRLAEYRHAYGPLAEAERECILARSGEIRDDGYFHHGHWLQAALILRHLFEGMVNNDAPGGPTTSASPGWSVAWRSTPMIARRI